jgi:hypothetical protein
MRKALAAFLIGGLVIGVVAAPAIAKKPKKKPPKVTVTQADEKLYLRDDDGCDTNVNYLSTQDGEDTGCWYVDTATYDPIVTTGLLTPKDLSGEWDTRDGVPFVLDGSKSIVGEISTTGGDCAADGAPCSPATLAAGPANLDVTIVGEVGGEEKTIGTFSDSYVATPASTHTSKVEIKPDASLVGQTITNLKVFTYLHGPALFQGTVVLDDPASFITLSTLVSH